MDEWRVLINCLYCCPRNPKHPPTGRLQGIPSNHLFIEISQLKDGFHGSCLATCNGDTRGIEATLPALAGVLSSNSDMQHMAVSMGANQENMRSKTMKSIKIMVGQIPAICKLVGDEAELLLDDTASILNAIDELDKMMAKKGGFPLREYGSLLHMVYNPLENRFYKQVAVIAYGQSGGMVNVRKNPNDELPDGAKVILVPQGVCITEWEKPMEYEVFLKVRRSSVG